MSVTVADPGFPKWAPTPEGVRQPIILHFFAENCMEMKEFGPGRGRLPGAPTWIRHWVGTGLVHIESVQTFLTFPWTKICSISCGFLAN